MVDPMDNLDGPPTANPAPPGTVDTHMHIFMDGYATDPASPVPLHPASVAEYRRLQTRLGIERAVVVQSNAYRFDNSCLEAALAELGDAARGIAVVTPETPEADLRRLTDLGVRGARIMDFGNGAVGVGRLLAVADRIRAFGWHVIVQFNGRDIEEKLEILQAIDGDYVIDHAGKFIDPVAPDDARFEALLSLIDRGNCFVKLSACYETSLTGPPGYDDVGALSRALVGHAPERLLWASNWPHVSATAETYPDDGRLFDLLFDWASKAEDRQRILVDNPARLCGFPD